MNTPIRTLKRLLFTIGLCAATSCTKSTGEDTVLAVSQSQNMIEISYFSTLEKGKCCLVIGHAGGAVDGNPYTNSLEALESNYDLGVRLFEMDLQMTSDGKWVSIHDWPLWKRLAKFDGPIPPDLETFENNPLHHKRISWSIESDYSPVSMGTLEMFLEKHPDAAIVTDVKKLELFENLVDRVMQSPNKNQFVFQAYSIDHVDLIKARDPAAQVILTLYRIGRPAGLYDQIAQYKDKLMGVTLPMNWAYDDETRKALTATQVPLFLHGAPANINSIGLHRDFAAKGIAGFYLD